MPSGIILAGGRGRRMGGVNKALLNFAGETLVNRQIRLMSPACSEIIVVADNAAALAGITPAHVRVVEDDVAYCGPLSGIERGLRAAKESSAWVVACDQPFVSAAAAKLLADVLKSQVSSATAAVPVIGGAPQPLHGCYHTSCASLAAQLLREGNRRVRDFLQIIQALLIHESAFAAIADPRLFCFDLDTPEQLAEALEWANRGQEGSKE